MKTIVVEITYVDPLEPDAFEKMDAEWIWNAMQRAFPLSSGAAWSVQEIEDTYECSNVGERIGGR